jgi:hypothetical protein
MARGVRNAIGRERTAAPAVWRDLKIARRTDRDMAKIEEHQRDDEKC